MPSTTISQSALQAAKETHPAGKPIYMLNLLRYRPLATYTEPNNLSPASGHKVYHSRYIPSLGSLMAAADAQIFLYAAASNPLLVGASDEKWDEVGIIIYPSVEAFEGMIGSEEYRNNCEGHRLAALEDWRLVILDKVDPFAMEV
jgi:hypothetical protein